jgi:ATP-dependent helicase HrpA
MDDRGKCIASGRNLPELRDNYREQVQQNIQSAATNIERTDIQTWDFNELPASVQLQRVGISIRAYPALIDKQNNVALQVLDNPLEAQYLSRRGIVRLMLLESPQTVKYLQKELFKGQELALSVAGIGSREQVVDDILMATFAQLCVPDEQPLPRTRMDFDSALATGKEQLIARAQDLAESLATSVKLLVGLRKQLKQQKNALALAFSLSDIQQQLQQLFYPGLIYQTPQEWLIQYPRYLRAIELRIEKALLGPQKDRLLLAEIQPYWQKLDDYLAKEGTYRLAQNPSLQTYRWWIEELRVSLFAQTLKTQVPISSKRLDKQWQTVTAQN